MSVPAELTDDEGLPPDGDGVVVDRAGAVALGTG